MDIKCPICKSIDIKKNGYYKSYQKYKCKNCNRQFSERSFSFFCRHRFPDEVIRNTILCSFFVSTRNAAFLAKETLNFSFTHVTAFNWIKKFAYLLSKLSRIRTFSNIWHIDEKFIKVRGCEEFAYLWVVIDDKNNIITTYVSKRRDINAATAALKRAKQCSDKPPDILVSDGLQAYNRSCRKVFGRKTKHIVAHFKTKCFMHNKKLYYLNNNRIESLNSKINLWYKKYRGFKSLTSAQLWCEMWMYFYNLIRPRVIIHQAISIHQII